MDKKIEVEIFGEIYPLKSDGDSSYVRQIAAEVDRSMREIAQKTHSFSNGRIGVLAALDIADRYFQLKKDYDELLELVEPRKKK